MSSPTGWWEPGIVEVAPGVHRIPLPLPDDALRAVNVYAVIDGDGVVLIDGGWALAEGRRLLDAALGSLGLGLGDVREFLVTHVHADHYTQAVALRRELGIPVSLGRGERPTLENLARGAERDEFGPLTLLKRYGCRPLYDQLRPLITAQGDAMTLWDAPDRWLGGIDLPLSERTLRVIETPGHTQGHVVFHDREAGLLFAGDHVLPHITPSIGYENHTAPFPLRDYLFSLQLIRALPEARLLPAHGPVQDQVHARVDELLDHHRSRLAQVHTAVVTGHHTARAVAGRLTWTRRERSLDELDPFNQMLAILEAGAHLEVLAERGVLARGECSDVVEYSA
jgi:glyoxylase-like metal-dependent hydrolase (beta-lactamase superfamily II)